MKPKQGNEIILYQPDEALKPEVRVEELDECSVYSILEYTASDGKVYRTNIMYPQQTYRRYVPTSCDNAIM